MTVEQAPIRIMVAEDSRTQALKVRHGLEQAGYQVTVASTGAECLELVRSFCPDLILLDVGLPDMSGFDVLARLRAAPQTAEIPVIFWTAERVEPADRARGLEMGAVDYITKGILYEEAIARVRLFFELERSLGDLQAERDAIAARVAEVEKESRERALLLEAEERRVAELAEANRKLELSHRRLAALFAISAAVSETLDLDRVLELALDRVTEVLPIESATIWLGQVEGDGLTLHAHRGSPEPLDEALVERAMTERRPVSGAGASCPVVVPLLAQGNAVGVLELVAARVLNDADLELLAGMGGQVGSAIQNALLFRQVRDAQDRLVRAERISVMGVFSAAIGHELRNPLSAIQSGADYLRATVPPDERTERTLDVIDRQVQRALRIIEDLRRFARLPEPERAPVDLGQVLAEACQHARLRDGITVEWKLDPALPPVSADAGQLEQVFLNLITNAADAMGGQGRLVLATACADGQAQVSVRDTGPGIAPENVEKIFEPLFTTKQMGTGLGLALARRVVEAHGGRITLESAPGRGSQFTVSLPLQVPRK